MKKNQREMIEKKVCEAKGQNKVILHEKMCGRKYK